MHLLRTESCYSPLSWKASDGGNACYTKSQLNRSYVAPSQNEVICTFTIKGHALCSPQGSPGLRCLSTAQPASTLLATGVQACRPAGPGIHSLLHHRYYSIDMYAYTLQPRALTRLTRRSPVRPLSATRAPNPKGTTEVSRC